MTVTEQTREHDADRIAEEFRLLIDAVARRTEDYLGRDGVSGEHARCPLCAVLAMARGDRTDLSARLSSRLAVLIASLRELLTVGERTEPADTSDSVHDPRDADRQCETKVHRIGVQRVSGSVLHTDPPAGEPWC